jgi:hypothetical protein
MKKVTMKKSIMLLAIASLSTPVLAEETSWFDSLKSLIGLGEEKTVTQVAKEKASEAPTATSMVAMLT